MDIIKFIGLHDPADPSLQMEGKLTQVICIQPLNQLELNPLSVPSLLPLLGQK